MRQSIPASYLTVHVTGNFDVDIYVDINGQWATADRGAEIVWDFEQRDFSEGKGLKTWRVRRANELLLSEDRDHAEWGTVHFTAPSDVRHESGTSGLLRPRFSRTGTLQNAIDNDFRGVMDEEPVFAFSKHFNLSSSSASSGPATDSVQFTIAQTQDIVAQFAAARGLTLMRPLWSSWFPSNEKLLEFHYLDFDNVNRLATNYSAQLAIDAYASGAQDYVEIAALTARQVMGGTSFAGTPDDPILFMKEISSDGNFQTIDVIFPSFPFFLYTNPRWLANLLEPILEYTLSGQYPNKYALHDLGSSFPNATGHPDGNDEYMPVEECGNILIMGLAVVNSLLYNDYSHPNSLWSSLGSQAFDDDPVTNPFHLNNLEERDGVTGLDDSWGGSIKGVKQAQKWVTRSYKLWKQWTSYLVEFSLVPFHQRKLDHSYNPQLCLTTLQSRQTISPVLSSSKPISLSKASWASKP